jgi:hypothetical protein
MLSGGERNRLHQQWPLKKKETYCFLMSLQMIWYQTLRALEEGLESFGLQWLFRMTDGF